MAVAMAEDDVRVENAINAALDAKEPKVSIVKKKKKKKKKKKNQNKV
jgi:hypothetical protein